MKHIASLMLILALTAALASTLPVSSFAGGAPPVALQATAAGGPTQDSVVGGIAAIGCGFGLRFGGLGGAWGVAATVIMCLIAVADGIRS